MTRRILVAGCWDLGPGYPRTESLVRALVARGYEVEECHVALPALRGTKSEFVARPWRWPGWVIEARRARARLRAGVRAAQRRGPLEAVLVPYPGHVAVGWVRSCYRGPIVLDLFLSAYGTAIDDRKLFRPGTLPARLLAQVDRRACRAADVVLLDTPEHAAAVAAQTGLPSHRFDWVPVSDTTASAPKPVPALSEDGPLRVVFFGTGVPLHGLQTWIDAVARVRGVRLELFGGDARGRDEARARLGERVDLRPIFAPMHEVRAAIDRSHVVAGIFGTSDKAMCVVPFKAVHGMAHGRLVVTADTPAVRRLCEPGVDCLVAPPGDPVALADVLRRLCAAPETLAAVGAAARRRFDRTFSPSAVSDRLGAILEARLGMRVPASTEPSPLRAVEPVTA